MELHDFLLAIFFVLFPSILTIWGIIMLTKTLMGDRQTEYVKISETKEPGFIKESNKPKTKYRIVHRESLQIIDGHCLQFNNGHGWKYVPSMTSRTYQEKDCISFISIFDSWGTPDKIICQTGTNPKWYDFIKQYPDINDYLAKVKEWAETHPIETSKRVYTKYI